MDRRQIAEEVLAAVGGRDNVTGNDICMTRLRILTENPALVDTEQLASTHGVLGFVRRGTNGIEVVFGPGKVEGVHDELVELTGVDSSEGPFSDVRNVPRSAPLHVRITPNPLQDAARAQRDGQAARAAAKAADETASVEDLVSLLDDMSQEGEAEPAEAEPAPEVVEAEQDGPSRRVLVLNGPNINMLGIREPDIYGHDSYQSLLRTCHEAASEAGFSACTCFQSNHEGDLIDAIQDAYGSYAGIIFNPGAYTHTSIAILDAAKAVGLPMVEVHISKVDEREEFRKVSYIRAACFETISGMGVEGYRKAIHDLAAHLGM